MTIREPEAGGGRNLRLVATGLVRRGALRALEQEGRLTDMDREPEQAEWENFRDLVVGRPQRTA